MLALNNKVLDSKEVAIMMNKRHANVLRDIQQYFNDLAELNLELGGYFQLSSYFDTNDQKRPCYKISRKGCEFLANKMTGKKGTLFTVAYINKFHAMEKHNSLPTNYIEALKELIIKEEEKQALLIDNKSKNLTIALKNQIIGELQPKANYVDIILKNKDTSTITQIAKDYGLSGLSLNSLIRTLGVQYKQSGQWLLYAKYQNHGYTHSQTVDTVRTNGTKGVKFNTKWTQKGRLFLYELLKSKGILPKIEEEE